MRAARTLRAIQALRRPDVHVFAEIILAGFGIGQHFVGPAVAEHLAGADHVAAVRDLQRLADLVIGDENRDPFGAQPANDPLDAGDRHRDRCP